MSAYRKELPNGYTVSVIDHGYGSDSGLFEIAAWETESGNWTLDRAPFTGDVIGWLSRDEVARLVEEISEWPDAQTL